MDSSTLVEGGADGLRRLADAYREDGFPVEAVYLIQRRSLEDDGSYWAVVLVISPFQTTTESSAIVAYVRLGQAHRLPAIAPEVRLEWVPPDHVEASRLLAYVRRNGAPPMVLRNVGTNGLLIDYALVAEDLGTRAQAA
jgi:hypothetical protein